MLKGKREHWEIGSMRRYAQAPDHILPKLRERLKKTIKKNVEQKIGITGDVMSLCDIEDEIDLRTLEGYEEYNEKWLYHYNTYTLPMFKKADEVRRESYRSEFKSMVIKLVDKCIDTGDGDLLTQFKKDIKTIKIVKNKQK